MILLYSQRRQQQYRLFKKIYKLLYSGAAIVVCMEGSDGIQLRVTPRRGRHIHSPTFSSLCDGSSDTKAVLSQGATWPPIWAVVSTLWLLSKWLTAWLSCHYKFSGRLHIFPSGSIHVIHFRCLLFTPWHRCSTLFWNPHLTCCQRSICNNIECNFVKTRCYSLFFNYFSLSGAILKWEHN